MMPTSGIYIRSVLLSMIFASCYNLPAHPAFPGDTLATESAELVILHTNDLHSKLIGSAPESRYSPLSINDDETIGGFARIAAVICQEKATDPEALVLDAGDFLMGSLFHALESDHGFQLPLMDDMGYDAISLGNHEFEFGTETLARIINSSTKNHTIPQLVLTNIEFNGESTIDDPLESLYHQSIIRSFHIIERKGLRIGIFALMGYDAASVAPFVAPAKFTDPVKTAVALSKKLRREENVDIIICLSHCGVAKNKKGEWAGEDAEIAKKAKEIDLIISGHTHTTLDQPLIVNGTPIVQTGAYGQNIGKLVIGYQNGQVSVRSYNLIRIDDSIRGDEKIHNLIETHKKSVDLEILAQVGLKYDDPAAETAFDMICEENNHVEESNLGPFLADALRYYVNHESGDSTQLSMIAAGIIRENMRAGEQTIADLFRIVSLGNGMDNIPGYPVAKVYVTGREIKNIIEILLAVYPSSPSNYCYYSGIRADIDPDKGLLKKVNSIEIGDELTGYRSVSLDKRNEELFGLSASAYLLHFVGMIKKKSFGLVNVIPKDRNGIPVTDIKSSIIDFNAGEPGIQEGKEWLGVSSYVRSFPDVNSNGIPDIPEYYRNYPRRLVITGK